MKKKIAFLMSVLFLLSSTSVFAEMPSGSVVFGNKAYSLKYVNDPDNVSIIRSIIKNLKADEKIYVKNIRGDWYANDGERVDRSIIPEVSYQTEEFKMTAYEAKDGKEVNESDFKVNNISVFNNNTVEILFSEKIDRNDFEKYFTVGGYIEVDKISLDSEGRKVSIKLKEDIKAKRYDLRLKISSKLKSANGNTFGIDYDEEILLLNKIKAENETFEEKVIIMKYGFKGKSLSFNNGVTISAPEVKLDSCLIKEINIDPGKGSSVELSNMCIDKIMIFSGGANSIHLDNIDIEEVYINSNENTRLIGENGSQIEIVTLDSSAIIETKNSKIKQLRAKNTEEEKKIELRCDVVKATLGNNSTIESRETIETLIIDGDVKLIGNFEKIKFTEKKVNVDIKSGTNIKNIDVKNNVKFKAEGNINVENISGTANGIRDINNAIEDGKSEYDYVPKNFQEVEMDSNGIKLKLKISKSAVKYISKEYKKVIMVIGFEEDDLSNDEKVNGIDVQIMNDGKMINYDNLKVKNNSAEMEFFIPSQSECKLTIFTEKHTGTDFELSY